MHKQLLIATLLTLGSIASVAAGDALEQVMNVLEAYAEDTTALRTGLYYELIEAAYDEAKKEFTPEELARKRKESAKFRLFQDFVLTPMDRWRPDSKGDDSNVKQAYMNRLERTYKHFWPAYIEENPVGEGYMFNAKRFMHFLRSMMNELPDQQPNPKMWREASKEYNSVRARIEEIVTKEDVYEHLSDLETELNFVNDYGVWFLMKHFESRLNACKLDADLESIVAEYRERAD